LNLRYLKAGKMRVHSLGRGFAWLDTGTHDSMYQAASFVQTVQVRQGFKMACIEEIAYSLGYITRAQLKAFLLRNGYRYTGKSAWTEAHRRYLRELVLPHGAQRVVLEDAIRAIGSAGERIARLEDQMHALLESWPMKPVKI